MTTGASQPATERRDNPRLRAMFAEACEVLAPFCGRGARPDGGSPEQTAYGALLERFPDLTRAELAILVIAARRVFATGGRPAP